MSASNQDKIVALTDVQIPRLRQEINSLRRQLRNVSDTFFANEDSFNVVADIALALQACETVLDLDKAIGVQLVSDSADHAHFYILSEDRESSDTEYMSSISTLSEELQTRLSKLNKTVCEPCREDTYKQLLQIDLDSAGSIALVPVAHEKIRGVLVIGAIDPDYYTRAVGTLYLDFLGASLGISANRVLLNNSNR